MVKPNILNKGLSHLMVAAWQLTEALIVMMLFTLLITSCDKDKEDNSVSMQDHDQNKMMSVMHTMSSSMDTIKMTNDPDNDFALMMKVHHQGAINMANLELKEGKDSTLHHMARTMIAAQQKEIATLDSFVHSHPASVNDMRLQQQTKTVMQIMGRNADLQIINGNVDHDFAILMIPHHQGAIDMAELEIHYGNSDKLKAMSEKMQTDQRKEIADLQNWLLDHK